MIPEASLPPVDPKPGYPRGNLYPVLVLLLTIPLAGILSNSFPVIGALSSAIARAQLQLAFLYFSWVQLVAVIVMTIAFYELGKRIDFATHYRMLATLTFVGALIGNLPGFYFYTTTNQGMVWGSGFGYVVSYGGPEPSSIIELLASAVAAFMIPLAGLALAYFRFQLVRPADVDAGSRITGAHRSPFSVLVAALVIIAVDFPVVNLSAKVFAPQAPVFMSNQAFWNELIPGYMGFLIYPTIFLIAFYLMGKGLYPGESGLRRFALFVFIGAVVGLLFSAAVATYISTPLSLPALFYPSNLPMLVSYLIIDGIFVMIVGFAASALGFMRTQKVPESNLTSGSEAGNSTKVARHNKRMPTTREGSLLDE
jgi:hypothetical protein